MNLAIKRTLSTSVLAAGALATVLASAGTAGASTIARSAPTAVTPASVTCTVSIVNGGHTVTERCAGTLSGYSQFRLVVNFCNTSNCSVAYGPWTNFGNTTSVTSGGYATRDSVSTQYR